MIFQVLLAEGFPRPPYLLDPLVLLDSVSVESSHGDKNQGTAGNIPAGDRTKPPREPAKFHPNPSSDPLGSAEQDGLTTSPVHRVWLLFSESGAKGLILFPRTMLTIAKSLKSRGQCTSHCSQPSHDQPDCPRTVPGRLANQHSPCTWPGSPSPPETLATEKKTCRSTSRPPNRVHRS
jgi:hypothetical protein